ncbi:NAD(P)-dependent oxidoreductase [Ovoidimarina sediminis]|uniref:NAD(P)-dependent oxidoreductase n=1 Tax=Ovoidimarina sediminis TaxID=3079856 RepID=UPI00290EEFAD|nr:DUF1932 domain-containing protein [Rhodophyticola sp. MJ-SS7]MDU8945422.1 DUF1932 domain-containing protein [Rhodophyticola sp. MJ-SS7]
MRITFIGLGEAAGAIISGWGPRHQSRIAAFDIKSLDLETAGEIGARAEALSVQAHDTREAALAGAELVFSTVTADQAVAAAEACAPLLPEGAVWCDLNSCAPASKARAAAIVTGAGRRYIDVAVMAPVFPKQNLVPCLISGPEAEALAPVLADLPMNVRVVGDKVGRASSIKLVRSIMVKGLEALTAECTLAAMAAGVGDEVFPSLKAGSPHLDVPERAAYNFERSLVHGIRRAAEMEEVAKMLSDLGLPNGMAAATAGWQARLGAADVVLPDDPAAADHLWFARAILQDFGVEPG